MATEEIRIKAQSFLDKMKAIKDNWAKGSTIAAPNGKQTHIGKDGQVLGYWENTSKYVSTNGDDAKSEQYGKNAKDLGFMWFENDFKALTPAEYLIQKNKEIPMYDGGATAIFNKDPLSVNKNTSNEPTTPNSNELSISNHQLLQYAVIGLIIYVVFIK
jgi:hypothetical protein